MLRQSITIVFLFLFFIRLSGQEPIAQKRLFLNESLRISAFGSITAGLTPFNHEYAEFMGGDCALVLNNFYFGGYGCRNMGFQDVYPENNFYTGKKLGLSHGGIHAGVNFRSKKMIQYATFAQIGWGSLSLRDNIEKKILMRDRITVFTPTLQVKLNLMSFIQLCAGVSYQFLMSVNEYPGLENKDFQGLLGSVSVRFGWF